MSATLVYNLLQEIKAKSESCLKNNEYASVFIGKVSGNLRENDFIKEGYYLNDMDKGYKDDKGDIANTKCPEYFEPLENILLDKLQENERLKTLNERLQISCQQKSQKIKDLTKAISLQNQQVPNTKEISTYKDKVGRCNVEIQKLRKQLSLENKKLQTEKVKVSRLEVVTEINQEKLNQIKNQTFNSSRSSKGCDQRIKKPEPSFEKLDEVYLQKTLKMIKLGEPNIKDETLEVPENLDSDSEDKLLSESPKESPDEHDQ